VQNAGNLESPSHTLHEIPKSLKNYLTFYWPFTKIPQMSIGQILNI